MNDSANEQIVRTINRSQQTEMTFDTLSFEGETHSWVKEPLGWLKINDGFSVAVYEKFPCRFHRWMIKIVFGWEYTRESPLKQERRSS